MKSPVPFLTRGGLRGSVLMRKTHLFAFLVANVTVVTGLLIACSSDDDQPVSPTPDAGAPPTPPAPPPGPPPPAPPPTPVDAGVKIETAETQIANAICNTLARCCFGDPNAANDAGVDAGSGVSGFF